MLSFSIINCRQREWTKTDFKNYLAADGKDHIFKGTEMHFCLMQSALTRTQYIFYVRKARESSVLKIDFAKMDGRYAVENIRGFSFFHVQLQSLRFSLIAFYWLWIPECCSTIWILSVSAIIRRPAAGLLAWAFCRALLLNFWTFCTPIPGQAKKKTKKKTADKEPQIADRLTF